MKHVYKKSKRRTLIILLWLCSSMAVMAQERVISGTVNDETGSPMPAVSVLVKGTTTGTVTDVNGLFKISAKESDVLLITFVGYAPTEVPVGSQTNIEVNLKADVTSLDEVIVTGYSVDKRRELTGALSTVKPKDLTFAPTSNVEQMFQGRVPGVTVITNGQPGTTSQVRVRGFGAFGSNQPLYIVDGVPTQNINFLNPDDIESTTVLKDAASASIYGARAASGVIVLTTRKGKRGQKLAVTYDGLIGFTTPGKGISMMNPNDFADWTFNAVKNTAVQNGADPIAALATFNHPQFGKGPTPVIPDYLSVGGTPGVTGSVDLAAEKLKYNVDPRQGSIYQVIAANKSGTDWFKEITHNAPINRQTLGFSGGGESHRFYVGLSAQNQQGILINNLQNRYAIRVNTEFDILKNLRVGENFQMTYIKALGVTGANGGQGIAADENDFLSAFRMPSIIPVHDVFGGYAGTAAKGFNNPRNPVANREGLANDRNFGAGGIGNLYVEFDPIPGLTLRSNISAFGSASFSRNYSRWQYENSENNSAFGFSQNQSYSLAWTFTNTAVYKKTFGDHSIELLAGQEALDDGTGWFTGQNGLNPFSWDPNYINIGNLASTSPPGGQQFRGNRFSSVFGNIKYAFKEKYIIGAVIRRDGSSRFGSANRYGTFPAASVAWRISSESFMQGIPFISDLKIRGSYGAMGNSNNVNGLNQYSLYGGDKGNSSYDINGSNSSAPTGFYRTRIGNSSTKWETSISKNIGFDGLFFDGKLDIVFDLWEKDTKDLLYQLPITATAGPNAAAPSVNVAKMTNKGIDLAITNKGVVTGDLKYEMTLTGSWLKNEISAIAPGQTYLTTINPGFRGLNPIRNQLNYPISSFYGYVVEGLFQNTGEVTAHATQNGAAPGRFKYKDLNGDGVIDDKDRTYLGSPVPKFTGGFNLTFRYKGFDLATYLYTSLGNKIFNVSKWFTDFYPSFQGAAIANRVKDSWTPTNTGATIPIFESASNFSTNQIANSYYVENGNYLRMQNVTLGYTLPASVLNKVKMTKLRVYVSANNLFTITKYQGLDPGVGGAADTNFGIDVGNYPLTRSYNLGLSLGF